MHTGEKLEIQNSKSEINSNKENTKIANARDVANELFASFEISDLFRPSSFEFRIFHFQNGLTLSLSRSSQPFFCASVSEPSLTIWICALATLLESTVLSGCT